MSNPNSKLYISHITEQEPNAPKAGDAQVLEATDKEKVENYEKTGNQSKDYYQK